MSRPWGWSPHVPPLAPSQLKLRNSVTSFFADIVASLSNVFRDVTHNVSVRT